MNEGPNPHSLQGCQLGPCSGQRAHKAVVRHVQQAQMRHGR